MLKNDLFDTGCCFPLLTAQLYTVNMAVTGSKVQDRFHPAGGRFEDVDGWRSSS